MKKTFWAVLIIAVVSFMSMGCFTSMLWDEKGTTTTTHYQETINAFMMSQDGKTILFASNQYHYLFKSDPALAFLLTHKDELPVVYKFNQGSYLVYHDNSTRALFSADVELNRCDPVLVTTMTDNHFGILNPNTNTLHFTFNLKGDRYLSDPKINDKLTSLRTPIGLDMTEYRIPSHAGETVKKILLTPLAIAADGVTIVIGAVILLPVLIFSGGR
jgi:hypothetical protein